MTQLSGLDVAEHRYEPVHKEEEGEDTLQAGAPAPRFYFFSFNILCSYDYNMHVEGLLPARLCLVTLLNSELI